MYTPLKTIVITIILILAAFFGGMYLVESGRVEFFTQLIPSIEKGSYEGGYEAGLAFARKRLAEVGYIEFGEEPQQYLFATIQSVNGNNVIVEFQASELDVFEEGLDTRKVIIADATSIEQHAPRPQEELAKEYEAYEKAFEEYMKKIEKDPWLEITEPQFPTEFIVKKLKISDLKTGDKISINTETDIKKTESFEASDITLEYNLEPPPIEPAI